MPLRHPWPHYPRRAQGQPNDREDMMNAHISRRDFAAGLGGIVVAFTLAPKLATGQQPAALPGSLNGNRMLDASPGVAHAGTTKARPRKGQLGRGSGAGLPRGAAEGRELPRAGARTMPAA